MNRSVLAALVLLGAAGCAADPAYVDEIQKWRAGREQSLRADNGWLTLAGRFPLKPGPNTFGTGKGKSKVSDTMRTDLA